METAARGNAAEGAVLNAFVQRGYGVSGGCLLFNSRGTDHGNGRRSYRGLADIFGVYFPQTDGVYLVPIDEVADSKGWLRVEPARNNQRRGVRFATDFEIDRWTIEDLRDVATKGQAKPELEMGIA